MPQRAAGADLDELVVAERAVLIKRARYLAGNDVDAGDLVQETIVRALGRRGEPDRGLTRGWLMTTMHNLFIDRCRSGEIARRAAQTVGACATGGWWASEEPPEPWWVNLDPPSIDRALARMSPTLGVTFQLFAAGASYAEIGRRQGISPATVGTRLHRARRRLRSLLWAEMPKSEPCASDLSTDPAGTIPSEPVYRAAGTQRKPGREDSCPKPA